MAIRATCTIFVVLVVAATLGSSSLSALENPETFETYGVQSDPWSPSQGVEGWEVFCGESVCDSTYEIGNFGPNSGSGTDLAFRQFGSANGRADWYATMDIVAFPQQKYSFDFRLVEGSTDQDRTRIIVAPLTVGNFRSPGQLTLDTITEFVEARLDGGDAYTSGFGGGDWSDTEDIDLGPLLEKDDVQGAEAPWLTYELEMDYTRDQDGTYVYPDSGGEQATKGQSRARIRLQDGSMDFDWTPWNDMGLDNDQIQRFKIIRNGTIDIDNLTLTGMSAGMPCDFNASTTCDDVDIDLLAAAVRNGTSDAQFNVDGLGDPNIPDDADFSFYITDDSMIGTGLGDADLNLMVNFNDFVSLSNDFGVTGTGWARGNFNTDDNTNFNDFVALSNNFGLSFISASNVPEPAGVGLLAAAAMSLGARRCRKSPTL